MTSRRCASSSAFSRGCCSSSCTRILHRRTGHDLRAQSPYLCKGLGRRADLSAPPWRSARRTTVKASSRWQEYILESLQFKSDFGPEPGERARPPLDYRCDNRSFCLSAHDCQVPTPTSQNLATRTTNSDSWSRLTHQFLGRLKPTIPNPQIYLPKKANSEKLGEGMDNLSKIVFLSLRTNKCLERVNDRHFRNPGVFSYAMTPRCRPNSRVFFLHCHIMKPTKEEELRNKSETNTSVLM